ncbi:uncharacterized protein LOC120817910 isoform X2 [Gasterosteus aculeatus]
MQTSQVVQDTSVDALRKATGQTCTGSWNKSKTSSKRHVTTVCHKCGNKREPRQCPAYGAVCHKCDGRCGDCSCTCSHAAAALWKESSRPASGPVIPCITCQKEVPFSEVKLHRLSCNGTPMQEREQEGGQREENDSETALVSDSVPVRSETSAESAVVPAVIVNEELDRKETVMKMDVRESEEDRERELLLFYKQQQEWACPLHCTLVGDVAVGEGVMRYFMTTIISKLQFGFSLDLGGMGRTLLFEGEPDHLVPAASEALIESNLFWVAGRMLAHTFLHDGPHVTGLSPAVIHVLFNGDPEMATVVVEDCPDLHIRSIIELLCNLKETLPCKKYCLGRYNK